MNPQEILELERGILERLHFASNVRIGAQLIHDVQINIVDDVVNRQLLVHLETNLLAERIETMFEMVAPPATWWDHWKQDHLRLFRWWSKWIWQLKWPKLNREYYKWTNYATFPHSSYVVPTEPGRDYLGPVVFYRQVRRESEESWDDE